MKTLLAAVAGNPFLRVWAVASAAYAAWLTYSNWIDLYIASSCLRRYGTSFKDGGCARTLAEDLGFIGQAIAHDIIGPAALASLALFALGAGLLWIWAGFRPTEGRPR
jgi:hypothetical protein